MPSENETESVKQPTASKKRQRTVDPIVDKLRKIRKQQVECLERDFAALVAMLEEDTSVHTESTESQTKGTKQSPLQL